MVAAITVVTASACMNPEPQDTGDDSSDHGALLCVEYYGNSDAPIEDLELKFWSEDGTQGTYAMAKVDSLHYDAVIVLQRGSKLIFWPHATRGGLDYYPFDVCDYPGSYCGNAGPFCVAAVGRLDWSAGECGTRGALVWTSDQPRDSGEWIDNPDSLGMCTANGVLMVQ